MNSKIIILIFIVGIMLMGNQKFITVIIGEHEFIVEVADTNKKKAVGLMFRKEIPDNFGMLFLYPDEDFRAMWMKNTLIYLDLVFLNSDKEIVDIKVNVPPCKNDPCETYISKVKARYVLELKGNTSKKLNITTGDRVFFILEPK